MINVAVLAVVISHSRKQLNFLLEETWYVKANGLPCSPMGRKSRAVLKAAY